MGNIMDELEVISIGDFDSQATDYLSELIFEKLAEDGIAVSSMSFSLEVAYIPEQETEDE